MEKDCVSLEMAKELERAGWKGETGHWWWEDRFGADRRVSFADHEPRNPKEGWLSYPAPTTTELAEWLPKDWDDGIVYYEFSYQDNEPDEWVLRCDIDYHEATDSSRIQMTAATLPDALAKMAVYLLDNKLV